MVASLSLMALPIPPLLAEAWVPEQGWGESVICPLSPRPLGDGRGEGSLSACLSQAAFPLLLSRRERDHRFAPGNDAVHDLGR
jgi:hypothetical protein